MDPSLLRHFKVDELQALLRVARGKSPDIAVAISSEQYECLRRHRVVPLAPVAWYGTPHHHADLLALQFLEDHLRAEAEAVLSVLQPIAGNVRFLKGMATRYLDYRQPSQRHTGDLDLLVTNDDYLNAVGLLKSAGYSQLPLRRLEEQYGKGTTLLSPRGGVEIDLHRRIARKRTPNLHIPFERAQEIGELGALAPPETIRLIHAATHLLFSVPGSRRLSGVADIAALTRSNVDLTVVRSVAEELQLGRETCAGLAIGLSCLGDQQLNPSAWGQLDKLSESAYLRTQRFGALDLLVRSRVVDTPVERGQYLIEVATTGRRRRGERSWTDRVRLAKRQR